MKILLLHGPNAYLSRKRLLALTSFFEKEHGVDSVFSIDGGNCSATKVLAEVDSISMFNPKKLVVVKYFSTNTESKKFVELLKGIQVENVKDVEFIFWENKGADKRSSFYKLINKGFEVEEFKELKGKLLIKWIIEEFKVRNQVVSSTIAEKIIERVGDEMWRINTEIEKLSLYKNKEVITIEDVSKAVSMSASVEVWGLTSSIVSANRKKALSDLERLMKQGTDIYHIWGLIVWQFRQLILIRYEQSIGTKPDSISSNLKMSPFIVKKVLNARNSISFSKLKVLYDKLVEIDYQIKTSTTEPLFAITLLLSVI